MFRHSGTRRVRPKPYEALYSRATKLYVVFILKVTLRRFSYGRLARLRLGRIIRRPHTTNDRQVDC